LIKQALVATIHLQIKNIMKKKIILLAFVCCLLNSCSKTNIEQTTVDPNSPEVTTELKEPGYGSSNKPFTATSWQLPADVKLEDSIHDYSYCWAFAPYKQVSPKDWKGVPLGFTFCLTLKNSSTHSIIVQFPPQLIFTSSSSLYQNVLVIDLGSVELIPGAMRTIVAQGFCVNKGRDIPQTYNEETENFLDYNFGPSVIPSALQEVVDIVKSKHITMNDVLKADGTVDNIKALKYSVIQKAIWEVTDGEGLTASTKKELLAL